ncbi:MAG: type VI secretion system protein TssA [Planctomycetota bacterium]
MADVRALLQPIRPDAPAGADLRTIDNTIGEIREHRRRDHPLAPNPKEADWRATADTSAMALQGKTKDLEIAAYLCEAWTRLRGLEGLRDGLELLDGLVGEFWPHVHPGIEVENGQTLIVAGIRRKWLSWIGSAEEFLESVRSVPLTAALGDDDPLRLMDYEMAMRMEEAQRANQTLYEDMVANHATSPDAWNSAFAATDGEQKQQTHELSKACLELAERLQTRTDELLQPDGMSVNLIPLRDLLEQVRDLHAVGGAIGDAPMAQGFGDAGAPAGGGGATPAAAGGGGGGGPLRSRQDAVRMLREVGAFLRTHEPHSPVSYLVERCVRWLNLGFEELMADLVKTEEGLARMRDTLGLQRDEQG